MTIRFLNLKEVIKRTGISRSTIYRLIGNGEFPKQFPVTDRRVVWLEDDIQDWLLKQLEKNNVSIQQG